MINKIPLFKLYTILAFFLTFSKNIYGQVTVKIRLTESNSNQFYDKLNITSPFLVSQTSPIYEYPCLSKEDHGVYVFQVPSHPTTRKFHFVLRSMDAGNCISLFNNELTIQGGGGRVLYEKIYLEDYGIKLRVIDDKVKSLETTIRRNNDQIKRLTDTNDILKDSIKVQKKEHERLKGVIQENTRKIDTLTSQITECKNSLDSLNSEINNLNSLINCQNSKMEFLTKQVQDQKQKLYYRTMHLAGTECAELKKSKGQRNLSFEFNLISSLNSAIEDSTFIIATTERIRYRLSIKNKWNNEIKDVNRYQDVEFSGKPVSINLSLARNLLKQKYRYELEIFNKYDISIGKMTFEKLGENCRVIKNRRNKLLKNDPGKIPFATYNNIRVNSVPDNRKVFSSINTTFRISETESVFTTGQSDGDRIRIYDCDALLKKCDVINTDFLIEFGPKELTHRFKHQEGFILVEHMDDTGTNQGCSVIFQVSNTINSRDNNIKLEPSYHKSNKHYAAFKYEVDWKTWLDCIRN